MVPVSERAPDRPLVLAHRGASHDHAEHTLGAYLAALDTASPQSPPDLHLIFIHMRRIDMPITHLQRQRHHCFTRLPPQIPGAQPQQRHRMTRR